MGTDIILAFALNSVEYIAIHLLIQHSHLHCLSMLKITTIDHEQSYSQSLTFHLTPKQVSTHAGCISAGVGRAFSRVCLFVRTRKRKRLELSTPKLIHAYSIAVARHVLTKGQKVKGQGHTVAKTVTARVASDYSRLVCYLRPMIRLPVF